MVFVSIALFSLGLFIGGSIFTLLWNWIAAPLLELKTLTILQGTAIMLVSRFLVTKVEFSEDGDSEKAGSELSKYIVFCLLILSAGWVLKGLI